MAKSPFFWSDYRPDEPPARKKRRARGARGWVLKLLAGLLLLTLLAPLALRWVPPPTSAFMLRTALAGPEIRYHWVPGHRIAHHLPLAVVASEDQKFPRHRGFDFRAIEQAMDENKYRARPRGASTISQQVAKNLFLWPGPSYLRKGIEAYFTVIIELLWPKRRILEVYLNIAQFGPGIFGAEAASRVYFQKPASRLDRTEAALLAAVLPSPSKLHAGDPSPYVRQRAGQIEAQMQQLGGRAFLRKAWMPGRAP